MIASCIIELSFYTLRATYTKKQYALFILLMASRHQSESHFNLIVIFCMAFLYLIMPLVCIKGQVLVMLYLSLC
jgi:hypothetical protein